MNHSCRHRSWSLLGAIAVTLFVLPVGIVAQSQDSQADLQQLKNRLEQLEHEMQQLKGQISAAEETKKATAATEAQETVPKEGEIKQQKSTIDVYGFVMLDSGYDFKTNDPDWFDVVRPTKLPKSPGEFAPDGKAYFSVRQTRFGVKTSTPTQVGDLRTQFEFELFGTGVDASQTTFRLRHAYGELWQIGAGQTWSPFMDIDVFPNSVEYWGPNGMVFFRNVQVRWMPIRTDRMRLIFAAERPGASADGGIYADRIELQDVKPKFDMPDFSWQARFMRQWGYVQFSGIFRKISWSDTNPAAPNLTGTVLGWGLNVSSNVNFGKKNIGRFAFVYGEGIQNYMNDAPVDVAIKNNVGNATKPFEGVALPVLGVVSFLDHNWSDKFSSSIGYSLLDIQNSNAQSPNDFHQGHYALTNLLYHPIPKVTIGAEFQFGRRVNFSDGFNVNDYRTQFSFKYDWGKEFKF